MFAFSVFHLLICFDFGSLFRFRFSRFPFQCSVSVVLLQVTSMGILFPSRRTCMSKGARAQCPKVAEDVQKKT